MKCADCFMFMRCRCRSKSANGSFVTNGTCKLDPEPTVGSHEHRNEDSTCSYFTVDQESLIKNLWEGQNHACKEIVQLKNKVTSLSLCLFQTINDLSQFLGDAKAKMLKDNISKYYIDGKKTKE